MKKYNQKLSEFEIENQFAIEQIKENRRSGNFEFVRLLPVYEDYYFEGNRLIRVGKIKESYNPNDNDDIPNLIGRVDSTKDHQILKFIKRYGELLNTNISIVNEDMYDKKEQIIYHIKTIRLCLDLLFCIDNDDEIEAEKVIKNNFTIWNTNDYVSRLAEDQVHLEDYRIRKTWINTSKGIFVRIVNRHIENIFRKAILTNDKVKSTFHYKRLVDLAYWKLLDYIEGGNIKLCEHCKTPFLQTNKSQRFCPRDVFSKESRCAIAYRQKQLRERKKIEKEGNDN